MNWHIRARGSRDDELPKLVPNDVKYARASVAHERNHQYECKLITKVTLMMGRMIRGRRRGCAGNAQRKVKAADGMPQVPFRGKV